MKKIIYYLLILMLLIPGAVKADEWGSDITQSTVTLEELDAFVQIVDEGNITTGSVVDNAVKTVFADHFTQGVTGMTTSIVEFTDSIVSPREGTINGVVVYQNDVKRNYTLDIAPIITLPIPNEKLLSASGYYPDNLAILIKNYYGLTSSVIPSKGRFDYADNIMNSKIHNGVETFKIGKNDYFIILKQSEGTVNFTESIVKTKSYELNRNEIFELYSFMYRKAKNDGTQYDASLSALDFSVNGEGLLNVLSTEFNTDVGSENMLYSYYYVNDVGFVIAVYKDLKTLGKMYLYQFVVDANTEGNQFAPESFKFTNNISWGGTTNLAFYLKNKYELFSDLQVVIKDVTNNGSSVTDYIASANYYLMDPNDGTYLSTSPIYIEHYFYTSNSVFSYKLENFARYMEKDSTQSVTANYSSVKSFGVEIPDAAKTYFDFSGSVLTCKETIPDAGVDIKIVFNRADTRNGTITDKVTVKMFPYKGNMADTIYGGLTGSVIEMDSPVSYLSVTSTDESGSVTFDAPEYIKYLKKINAHKGETSFNPYDDNINYEYGFDYIFKKVDSDSNVADLVVKNFDTAGTTYYNSETKRLYVRETTAYASKTEGVKRYQQVVAYKFEDTTALDTFRDNIDAKLEDAYTNGVVTITSPNQFIKKYDIISLKSYFTELFNNYLTSKSVTNVNWYIAKVEYAYDHNYVAGTLANFRVIIEDKTNSKLNYLSKNIAIKHDLSMEVTIYDDSLLPGAALKRNEDIRKEKGSSRIFDEDIYYDVYYSSGDYSIRTANGLYFLTKVVRRENFDVAPKYDVAEIVVGETASITDLIRYANYTESVITTTETNKDTEYLTIGDDYLLAKQASSNPIEVSYKFDPTGEGETVTIPIKVRIVAEGNLDIPIQTVGTTITAFKANYPGRDIKVYESNGTTLANNKLKTGQIVKYGSRTYTITVKGDPSGDGAIDFMDYVKVYNHIDKKTHSESTRSLLEGVYFTAGDYDASGDIDFMDYVKIYNYINKK